MPNDGPDEDLLTIDLLEDLQELKCILDGQVIFLLFLISPILDSGLPEKEPRDNELLHELIFTHIFVMVQLENLDNVALA